MSGRSETLDQVRRKEITKTDAAKLLGVSRTRVNQLLKSKERKAAAPAAPAGPSIVVVNPSPADPGQHRPAAPQLPPPGPVDLKDVLAPLGGGAPAGAPPPVAPGSIPVDAVPHNPDAVNADDAEAGRELLNWLRKGLAEITAKYAYKVPAGDPRLVELKEENKFLKVALKRNSDKAAPLGWFTRGYLGLALGFGMEMIRVMVTCAPSKSGPRPAAPPPPSMPPESAAPVQTVQEIREEVEEGRKRPTIEERIAAANARENG